MDKCACFISLLFFALPLQAQEMEQLGWLAGNWVHQQAGEEVQETWLGPRHGVMVGINLTSAEGPRTNFELMRIARKDERIVYFASPQGRPPVEFPLKEMTANSVIFENPSHDFPRRIVYRMESDQVLLARIEGIVKGAEKSEAWRFRRRQ